MKASKLIWRSRDGRETSLRDMDTDHLLNLVMYLNKRQEEFNHLVDLAQEKDLELPPLMFRDVPYSIWVAIGVKELNRRREKMLQKSQAMVRGILNSAS